MNATHTPGPWRDSAYTCTERGRSGPTHAIVCDRDNGHNGSIVADYISNPANARLIAAAPALLAALLEVKRLRDLWRSQEDDSIDSVDYMDGLDRIDVDAVLALARGS